MEELLNRINELARKKKTEGLTDEEAKEREELIEQYRIAFRGRLRQVLDNVEFTSEFEINEEEINDLTNLQELEQNDNIVSVEKSGTFFKITYKDNDISEKEIREILAK